MCFFGIIQMVFSYVTSDIGFFKGYRLHLGMLSLAGPEVTQSGLVESLAETLPDMVYSLLIFVLLVYVKHTFRAKQFTCEDGILARKTTPAVLLQDFFADDLAVLEALTRYKQVIYIEDYSGQLYGLAQQYESLQHYQ